MYGYLKNTTQTNLLFHQSVDKSIHFIGSMIFKRLIRIMPLYLVIMLMTEVTATYFRETSIIEISENYDHNCRNYFWRNLLFIQNLFPFDEVCLNWSWTLACELQFFVVATVIYVIYCKNKLVGKLAYFGIVCFFYCSETFLLIKYKFLPTFDIYFTTLNELYISPLSRAPSYFVGVGLGYLFAKKDIKMSKVILYFT